MVINLRSLLAMKETYSWLTYSCLIFGTGILCDRKLERRQAGSSCSLTTEDSFSCSNGQCIVWSNVCDGRKDCSDGSDENKELCARYEYRMNTTECGREYITDNKSVSNINGEKTLVGTVPWNAAIYQKHTSKYDLTCGGSIISPNLVISAAHCYWYKGIRSKISIDDDSYKVAVGKYDRNFTVIDNDFTQIMKVEFIYVHEEYVGGFIQQFYDVAVIKLLNRITFSNIVTPVCIDWSGKYDVPNGTQGKVVGWGITKERKKSPVLLEESVQYIDQRSCRKINNDVKKLVTDDKFCTSSALGEGAVTEGFSGAGLSFIIHYNSYYLTGITCFKKSSVLGFTDIRYHIDWIRNIYIKYLNNDIPFCVLPVVDGVIYSYENSNEILAHGAIIDQYRTVIENCDVGYHNAYPNGFRVCRGNGKWISTSEKLCVKMCPPLLSDSLDIKCTLNGKSVNCSNPSIPNTIALPSCKPTYIAPIGLEETPFELICQSNGTWNNRLYKCKPYCGKVYTNSHLLIANGTKAHFGTAPWNVGIYRLNKGTSNYDLICGGSIISPSLVVSAAHCFWYKGILSNKISINDDSYKVAVGKYDRNFTVIDNDFTRIMNVEIIYLNDNYFGANGYHAHDIAIVSLSNKVSFSNVIAPICIDWSSQYNVKNGVEGKIVGWGRTEIGTLSSILLETSLPYIDHYTCRDMYRHGFQLFVTLDKFCAGSALVPGQDMGEGDSGSGLIFLHSQSYFLTGILSLKQQFSNNSIAVFTDVKNHVQWIHEKYKKHQ
ncbi:uncharacterized protein LOC132921476 isoform X1 [Rhopalosiphum padi]|uniref:uncharacterized protein LOC132921476 isoform X1 n=1 Tax=Rhopalosiphum padi TaxID=40932 RepID=UPI00298D712E|nr:uncharacterized protein LOC132921476 isoform X1 [Rhopalosiphum padi]XP_060840497.1 uncharacterized protein LOC132921476 isoform X1 [Rhopalosiphum padi]